MKTSKFFLQFAGLTLAAVALSSLSSAQVTVSTVNTSGQKFAVEVDGSPFLLHGIQVRMDKLRDRAGWNAAQRAALITQVAAVGFTHMSVPLLWYDVETSKDHFNWTYLDEYLNDAKANHLKMEILWFGANSDGNVQWLGTSTNPIHLRTPDYVLFAPSYGSNATTSDYKKTGSYTLDMGDANLKARETYVLNQVMNHVASWDAANGNPHTVIGVQMNNEAGGFSDTEVQSYLSGVSSGVKNSNYVVYTRANRLSGDSTAFIKVNEAARSNGGTSLDFAGDDDYTSSASSIQTAVPAEGKNFRMVMENSGTQSNTDILELAALSGDEAYNIYDMCGTDGNGLYDITGSNTCTPHGSYVTNVTNVNHMLSTDPVDLASNAQGQSLYVYNALGNNGSTSNGIDSISYTPTSSTDQGIAILRSKSSIVLMSTKGGTFTYPSSLGVNGATTGLYKNGNQWYSTNAISTPTKSVTTSVTLPSYGTARLTLACMLDEAENSPVTNSSGVSYAVYNTNPGASNGSWGKLLSNAVGQWVQYTAGSGIVAGTNYDIRVGIFTGSSRGQVQMYDNGNAYGPVIDQYEANSEFTEVDLGSYTPGGSGAHTFKFQVTGKNAASSSYTIGIDYIRIIPN